MDILLSPEEARATWDRLLGEDERPSTTPPAPAPEPRPAPDPTAAMALWPPLSTANRRRVPRVGTYIQRSGDRSARKLLELAFPPPPPPPRSRPRPCLRAVPAAPPGRMSQGKASGPTARPREPGPRHDRPSTVVANTGRPAGREAAEAPARQTEPPPRRPSSRPRVVSNHPFRGRIVLQAAPDIPTIVIVDDDDPAPPLATSTPPPAAEDPTPVRRRPDRPTTRTLTVEPGVTLDVPLRAIHFRRMHRTKAHGFTWVLRFAPTGVLRSVVKR